MAKKKTPKPLPKLPRITRTEVTSGVVRIEIERGDKTIYHLEVVPHDQDVLVNFSFIEGKVLIPKRTAANHVVVQMEEAAKPEFHC
jgi:hypothetical protein